MLATICSRCRTSIVLCATQGWRAQVCLGPVMRSWRPTCRPRDFFTRLLPGRFVVVHVEGPGVPCRPNLSCGRALEHRLPHCEKTYIGGQSTTVWQVSFSLHRDLPSILSRSHVRCRSDSCRYCASLHYECWPAAKCVSNHTPASRQKNTRIQNHVIQGQHRKR